MFDLDAWMTSAVGDAGLRTHDRVREDTKRSRVHAIERIVRPPAGSGLPHVYITRCGRSLLVEDCVRTARPVTCKDGACQAAETRKAGIPGVAHPGADRS